MGLLDRLDHLDEQVGFRARPPCPGCISDFKTMSVPEQVPLAVRMRFASGLRVPRDYVPWALEQVLAEGWPVRQVFMRVPMITLITVGVYSGFLTLGVDVTWGTFGTVAGVQLAAVLIFGSWIGAFNPKWIRERALAAYVGQPRRGCPIHRAEA